MSFTLPSSFVLAAEFMVFSQVIYRSFIYPAIAFHTKKVFIFGFHFVLGHKESRMVTAFRGKATNLDNIVYFSNLIILLFINV